MRVDIDQLHRIMQLLGKPDAELLQKITADVSKAITHFAATSSHYTIFITARLEDMLNQ